MKKLATVILVAFYFMLYSIPVIAISKIDTPKINKPYEKLEAKNGSWYTEQIAFDNSAEFVVAYTGDYKIDSTLLVGTFSDMKFKLGEKTVLKGIYLPYTNKAPKAVTINLKNDKGNIYGPFPTQINLANTIVEKSTSTKADVLSENLDSVNYVYIPSTEIVLPTGQYTMSATSSELQVRTSDTGTSGAFLIKGINYSASEKYKKNLISWELQKNPQASKEDAVPKTLGNQEFGSANLDMYKFEKIEKAPTKKPATFSLKADSQIVEVVLNTYNDGKGATPGSISILDNTGAIIATYQASGGSLGNVANGTWLIAPNIVLPAGDYFIGMSDPKVISYDKLGNPEFFVTASLPPEVLYDFTGTYNINLNTYKTSTLMGAVDSKTSSFSLKDFELTVLDKDGSLELIGKYEGIPFSQGCTITEQTENKIVATFNFAADLTKLPYSANIGAVATITMTKPNNKEATISIKGVATYQRAATKEKGADSNTYDVVANGMMKQKELLPFVMAALGTSVSVGNIPGPGSPMEAAAGLLFPTLVGLIVNVIQDAIRKKQEEEDKKPKKYTKAWYQAQNPGCSDETIAMIMLGDALGGSNDPDNDSESTSSGGSSSEEGGNDNGSESSGDESGNVEDQGENAGNYEAGGDNSSNDDSDSGESEGDNLDNGDPDNGESESDNSDKDDSDNSESEGDNSDNDNSNNGESESDNSKNNQSDKNITESTPETKNQDEPAKPEETPVEEPIPSEPETMTIQTDYTGRMTEYVKDAQGNWVNPLTGGVLDLETYTRDVAPNFERDKAFIEGQRTKLETGDTEFDRNLKAAEQARKDAAAADAYMQNLAKKYGTSDVTKLKEIIADNKIKAQKSAENWNKIGDIAGAGENVATVVSVVSDTAIDGLANVTGPLGRTGRAIYKVTKGMAGTMADKGPSLSSAISGAVKGGADAATDYINNPIAKAGVTILGESIGGSITDGTKGFKDGLVDGVFKVGVGAATDKIGGSGFGNDVSTLALKNGSVRVAIKSGDKWVGKVLSASSASKFIDKKMVSQVKQSMVKATSGLIDEFGVKPGIAQPIKDRYK